MAAPPSPPSVSRYVQERVTSRREQSVEIRDGSVNLRTTGDKKLKKKSIEVRCDGLPLTLLCSLVIFVSRPFRAPTSHTPLFPPPRRTVLNDMCLRSNGVTPLLADSGQK